MGNYILASSNKLVKLDDFISSIIEIRKEEKTMRTFIAVDLGGTNIRAALVDEKGKILDIKKDATQADKGKEHVMKKMEDLIASLKDYEKADGIGLGIPGPTDTINGKIIISNNLPDLVGYPIADRIREHFHKPTFMANDVKVAGLAEALLGQGQGKNNIYYLTISTGVAGAMILDGKVLSGYHGHGGEIGNMSIDPNRLSIGGLNRGAAESWVSGPALVREAEKACKRQFKHAGEVFEAAKDDERAKAVVERFKDDLAVLLAGVCFVCDPEMILIQGGVMKSSADFLKDVEERMRALLFPGMRETSLASATIEEPGLVGAAMLAKSLL